MNDKVLLVGIKHFIKHRKKRIAELTDPKQEWNEKSEELPAKVARMVAKNMNQEIEYFEEILKLAKKKPNDSKKSAKPL